MFDSLTIARRLTDAGVDRDQADVMADAIRQAAEHGDHVTPDQVRGGLAEMHTAIAAAESRLTWRFAGAMLAQTVAILGGLAAILRMVG